MLFTTKEAPLQRRYRRGFSGLTVKRPQCKAKRSRSLAAASDRTGGVAAVPIHR
jgi:hypothetical protein